MRIVDTLIVFRILKLLVTPFSKHKAFKFGFIDKNGKRLKTKMVDGKEVPNKPESKMEKASFTLLHRLVFNLRRIIEKVPFGKTAFASYAVALLMLKEHCELTDEQAEELYEKFYRHLKDTNNLDPEQITEAVGFPTLHEGTYNLRHRLDEYKPRTAVHVKGEAAKIFGISVYEGYVGDSKIYVSAEDVY
tara:strand:+ start:339 stop:908 length:570 start_codon:yes stop_codon:yes gene_type:complete